MPLRGTLSALQHVLNGSSKKVDIELVDTQQNMTRDSTSDVLKMATHLLENQVSSEQVDCTSPPFQDATENGFAKMSDTWLKHVITHNGHSSDNDNQHQHHLHRELELDYELHHVK